MHFATLTVRLNRSSEHTGHNLGTVPQNYTNAELSEMHASVPLPACRVVSRVTSYRCIYIYTISTAHTAMQHTTLRPSAPPHRSHPSQSPRPTSPHAGDTMRFCSFRQGRRPRNCRRSTLARDVRGRGVVTRDGDRVPLQPRPAHGSPWRSYGAFSTFCAHSIGRNTLRQ